jgi:mycofactocin system glycosyltransferase
VTTQGLPDGFTVTLRDDVRVLDHGRVLVGGSPTRVARLTAAGAALVQGQRVTVADRPTAALADRLLDGNLAVPDLRSTLPADPRDLSVVIPVHERVEGLDRLLGRLRPALTCVVVDDGSVAGAALREVARRHGAQLLVLPQNRGPAAARNAGLRAASTPYVALVDSDVLADPATLLGLCGHFADPRVAAVAPRVRGVAPSRRPRWFHRYDEVSQSLDLGDRQSLVRPGSEVSWLPAACLLVRGTDVCGPGLGFDEELRVAEDVDLVWRLVGRGRRVRYDAGFVVGHDSRPTLRSWLARKAYYGTGGALLAQRHGSQMAPAVVSPVLAVAAVALLAQRRWSAPVALLATCVTAAGLRGSLPLQSGRSLEAGRLASLGLLSTVSQTAQLVLRHWWPVAAAASVLSSRARWAVLASVLVDALVTPCPPGVPVVQTVAARRLDDLAYGSGLWYGALRARSTRALRIRLVGVPGRRQSGVLRSPVPRPRGRRRTR